MIILYVAELVGKAGIHALKQGLPRLKASRKIDMTIVCADGATGGNGLGKNHAGYLRKLGADVITLGECCFYKKDLTENIEKIPYLLRPENLNPQAPGRGVRVFHVGDSKVAVAVLLGQAGFGRLHGENPFARLPSLLERLRQETPSIILDFHAQTTGEKLTLLQEASGRCSALIGSHTRVQSADERITPEGTAYISDAGRSGSVFSVGGSEAEGRIREYLTGIPEWTREAAGPVELQGVLLDLDKNGKAHSIERIREPVADLVLPPKEAKEEEAT